MAQKFYFYGTVMFNTAAKRNAAGRRLDSRATQAGFTADLWPDLVAWFGPWPAGRADVTVDGLPGVRFCYSTMDGDVAEQAMADVAAAWDVFKDSNSSWGTAVITVPG